MNEEQRERGSSLIPPEEKRCIWMDAGVVTLKICDRDFDCERCPLDRALRGEEGEPFPSGAGSGLSPLLEPFSRFPVDTGRHYHPGHTWVKVENPGLVRIGLDPLLTAILGTMTAVSTRRRGAELKSGEPLGEIVQDDRCFTVLSPVSGKVLETNRELLDGPALASVDPLGNGWLLDAEPEELGQDLSRCRTGRDVLAWYLKGMDWINAFITPDFSAQRARLGPTLYDGGLVSRDLKDLLPPDRYRNLITRLLRAGDDWEAGE